PNWREKPAKGSPNPYAELDLSRPWPVTEPGTEALARIAGAQRVRAADPNGTDVDLDMIEAAQVAEWDNELSRLIAEARADRSAVIEVPLPENLSATAFTRLRSDPENFVRELARPMPRPPSRAARFGTRFHAWVESRFGQQ